MRASVDFKYNTETVMSFFILEINLCSKYVNNKFNLTSKQQIFQYKNDV